MSLSQSQFCDFLNGDWEKLGHRLPDLISKIIIYSNITGNCSKALSGPYPFVKNVSILILTTLIFFVQYKIMAEKIKKSIFSDVVNILH